MNLDSGYIENFIRSKKSWIEEIQQKLDKIPKAEVLQYITGEKLYYLGVIYELEVALSNENRVFLHEGKMILKVKEDTFELKKNVVSRWYFEKSKVLFKELMEKYLKLMNEEIDHLSIKKMKSRWGSCNHRKKYINLNVELIKTWYFFSFIILS